MPRMDDPLDQVADAKSLSKLDLQKGFYQVPMEPSQMKTAFLPPGGNIPLRECLLASKMHLQLSSSVWIVCLKVRLGLTAPTSMIF